MSSTVSNQRVHLQEHGWTYRYGTICLHANGISRLLIPYNRLPVDEPSGSKHVEDIVKIKILVSQRCILLVYII